MNYFFNICLVDHDVGSTNIINQCSETRENYFCVTVTQQAIWDELMNWFLFLISRDYISNENQAPRSRQLHYWDFQKHLMSKFLQASGRFWKTLQLHNFICMHRNIFKISSSVFTTHGNKQIKSTSTAGLFHFRTFKKRVRE